jgi:hypothetical protein
MVDFCWLSGMGVVYPIEMTTDSPQRSYVHLRDRDGRTARRVAGEIRRCATVPPHIGVVSDPRSEAIRDKIREGLMTWREAYATGQMLWRWRQYDENGSTTRAESEPFSSFTACLAAAGGTLVEPMPAWFTSLVLKSLLDPAPQAVVQAGPPVVPLVGSWLDRLDPSVRAAVVSAMDVDHKARAAEKWLAEHNAWRRENGLPVLGGV